ncbi:hypothetical protein SAY86_023851 [Trapa natans]|uniref:AAA+ ATPase domain-containing protein n=1 Tax=Trapa natans TaxID=22666 RepID=A0AAN7MB47_TRANT|nr:hypothetical protein SAY86_023851 [Trapa natans]
MEIISHNVWWLLLAALPLLLILRVLFMTSALQLIARLWRSVEDHCHVYQFFTVPQLTEQVQENDLYRKVSVYLGSLSSLEDSQFTHLLSGSKSNDIVVRPDPSRPVRDRFLGAEVSWKTEGGGLVLTIRKRDKRRILKPYLQHIFAVSDEIEQNRREIRLMTNSGPVEEGRWRSVPFTHPATMDTIVMDTDMKAKVKSDLESFVKSKQYYHRIGRVWKRSYLLHGPTGTGKSSFIAAMAKFLGYDVYDIDMSRVLDDSDLKLLLMQTTSKSIIVVEDLDRFILPDAGKKPTSVSISGVLSFMDGIISCCGDERIMVFTMSGDRDRVEEAMMRPGRVDFQIHFPLCDFAAFKSMANSYLGAKDHKLFPQVEELFQLTGPSLSPAHIGEIMITNRSSQTRAIKSVIGALQTVNAKRVEQQRLVNSGSGRSSDESAEPASVICRESVHTVREIRKLYGLLKMGSRRKESIDLGSADQKEVPKLEA